MLIEYENFEYYMRWWDVRGGLVVYFDVIKELWRILIDDEFDRIGVCLFICKWEVLVVFRDMWWDYFGRFRFFVVIVVIYFLNFFFIIIRKYICWIYFDEDRVLVVYFECFICGFLFFYLENLGFMIEWCVSFWNNFF